MKQIMLLRKLRIRTLREMIPRGMMLPVIRPIDIDEPCRISLGVFPVALTNLLENLINQPHVPVTVQVKNLPQFCERLHEQVLNKRL